MEYPLKHIRLKQLLEKNLNIVDFIHFDPNAFDIASALAFFSRYKIVSVRHFHSDESKFFKCPVKYEIKDFKVLEKFVRKHNKKFHTLINQTLQLKDSVFCGNILWYAPTHFVVLHGSGPITPRDITDVVDEKFLFEYFYGTGTPRDLEKKNRDEILIEEGSIFRFRPRESRLNKIVDQTYGFLSYFRPLIIEFSWYPYPVGILQDNVVYWEWRRG